MHDPVPFYRASKGADLRKLATPAVAGSALLSGIVAAGAADMPFKARPMVAPPLAFSWTGFYIGANICGAWTPNNGSSVYATDQPAWVQTRLRTPPLRQGTV